METSQLVQNLTQEMFNLIGVEAQIKVESENDCWRVDASVPEAGFLIGHAGENLKALQHILSLMIAKRTNTFWGRGGFILDINNYQKERESFLVSLAKNAAYEAQETKNIIALDPMNAFDRRIIHLAVEKIGGVASESRGEGEARRVVIRPA